MKMQKDAEDGDVNAMVSLAVSYMCKSEKKANSGLALKYSMMAADRGDFRGIVALVGCYAEGIGVEKNVDKAKEYVDKAISKFKGDDWKLKELKKIQEELERVK